jgi:hypothetical protein
MPFARWLYLAVLTIPSLCARQLVSAPHSLSLFRCPDDSSSLCLTDCECSSLASLILVS